MVLHCHTERGIGEVTARYKQECFPLKIQVDDKIEFLCSWMWLVIELSYS